MGGCPAADDDQRGPRQASEGHVWYCAVPVALVQRAHRAYLHAADAVLAARHPHQDPADPVTARVTADIYLALPDSERDAITHTVASRLGDDWLGPRHSNADTLITAPAYAAHLHTALVERCHLLSGPGPVPLPVPTAPVVAPRAARQIQVAVPMEHQQPQAGVHLTY
ncbi:hypothetical protein [Catenuloplanes atrovinosus]|uniref:Uncharacterized protein n=1 Tax=Catenuloplanes atrovinosus TaxID=137266 RepID=A0AAE3YLG1_9ACTN|nr:hypothetical protein [Catenuloplanes atrovinosus]MDR7276008.1 hypothetical protein [Catenuloplanes atrovinosus]